MTRYAAMFERCARLGEGAFGGFLMLGDPTPELSAAYLDELVEGGADMVELGIPFSDPVADGPVIQAAAERAVAAQEAARVARETSRSASGSGERQTSTRSRTRSSRSRSGRGGGRLCNTAGSLWMS